MPAGPHGEYREFNPLVTFLPLLLVAAVIGLVLLLAAGPLSGDSHMVYDTDEDGQISLSEALAASRDMAAGTISGDTFRQVWRQYMNDNPESADGASERSDGGEPKTKPIRVRTTTWTTTTRWRTTKRARRSLITTPARSRSTICPRCFSVTSCAGPTRAKRGFAGGQRAVGGKRQPRRRRLSRPRLSRPRLFRPRPFRPRLFRPRPFRPRLFRPRPFRRRPSRPQPSRPRPSRPQPSCRPRAPGL